MTVQPGPAIEVDNRILSIGRSRTVTYRLARGSDPASRDLHIDTEQGLGEKGRPVDWVEGANSVIGSHLTGKRNRAMLAILLGCGQRRRELAELTFGSLQRREERWAMVDLVGKGRHIRTVPVSSWVEETVDAWLGAAGISNAPLFRCVCRAGKLWGHGISEKTVWHVVKKAA